MIAKRLTWVKDDDIADDIIRVIQFKRELLKMKLTLILPPFNSYQIENIISNDNDHTNHLHSPKCLLLNTSYSKVKRQYVGKLLVRNLIKMGLDFIHFSNAGLYFAT